MIIKGIVRLRRELYAYKGSCMPTVGNCMLTERNCMFTEELYAYGGNCVYVCVLLSFFVLYPLYQKLNCKQTFYWHTVISINTFY